MFNFFLKKTYCLYSFLVGSDPAYDSIKSKNISLKYLLLLEKSFLNFLDLSSSSDGSGEDVTISQVIRVSQITAFKMHIMCMYKIIFFW